MTVKERDQMREFNARLTKLEEDSKAHNEKLAKGLEDLKDIKDAILGNPLSPEKGIRDLLIEHDEKIKLFDKKTLKSAASGTAGGSAAIAVWETIKHFFLSW